MNYPSFCQHLILAFMCFLRGKWLGMLCTVEEYLGYIQPGLDAMPTQRVLKTTATRASLPKKKQKHHTWSSWVVKMTKFMSSLHQRWSGTHRCYLLWLWYSLFSCWCSCGSFLLVATTACDAQNVSCKLVMAMTL